MSNQEIESSMRKSVEAAQRTFNTIRTGRANPSLLDRVTVEYYGADTPLKSLATISIPDSQTISIQPFDQGSLSLIEKAIATSALGLTPNNDGHVIRLNIPSLTEERRQELVKQVHGIVEDGRIAIRNIRRDSNDQLKKLEKSHDMSEDNLKRALDNIQEITNQHIETLNQIQADKEKELLF